MKRFFRSMTGRVFLTLFLGTVFAAVVTSSWPRTSAAASSRTSATCTRSSAASS
ncbi:MAG: hypothetical protein ACLGI6_19250 [Gammaproteobacteria bacterium]